MIVRLIDLTLGYDRHPAVHHLDGVFAAPGPTAVVGPNGAGKSTLLKGIMGLVRPLSGRVEIAGGTRHRIAYLPQQAELDLSFPITVRDVVLLGHWRRAGAFAAISSVQRDEAAAALAAVGLAGFEGRRVGSLSVGQRQRMLFARLMLEDGPVVLLDEPFAAVDARTEADLLAILDRWTGEGRTVICVLHDLGLVRRHFPHTLLLARAAVGWGPTAEVVTDEALARLGRMSEAWNDQAPPCRGARR